MTSCTHKNIPVFCLRWILLITDYCLPLDRRSNSCSILATHVSLTSNSHSERVCRSLALINVFISLSIDSNSSRKDKVGFFRSLPPITPPALLNIKILASSVDGFEKVRSSANICVWLLGSHSSKPSIIICAGGTARRSSDNTPRN